MITPRYLSSRRVVLPDGVRPARIELAGEKIVDVTHAARDRFSGRDGLDLGDSVVMPGIVDTHVHLNEPGRSEWEGFWTGTRAAAAGGVTTVIDMPLNSIPATTSVASLMAKRQAAQGRCWVDVGFWGGIVPHNARDLEGLYEAGVFGFKCFLVPSGVDEFPHVDERRLRTALPELRRLGAALLVHAEDPDIIADASASRSGADLRAYATWLATRPPRAERQAIELMILLCDEFQVRVHIVHVSALESIEPLAAARRRGLPLTAETCPHYLVFCADEIPDGATAFKCAPPIRERPNREGLWQALTADALSMIASDHSPAPPGMKALETGDLLAAWGGISSLQLSLPATWTAARSRGRSLEDISRWMSSAPARLAGLEARKGTIAPGCDADFVVWNPEARWTVDARALQHRHPFTPYDGRELSGEVEMTMVGGRIVYRNNRFADQPAGRLLRRPGA
ncbi:MAG: allantoinase AllB [Acidobacteria bacterium]|nr:allantoinase AllB [Acidobacteriota bacterium]